MTDRALANAEARQAELTARLQELEREAENVRAEQARVEAFIRDWHAFAAAGAGSDGSVVTGPAEPRVRRVRTLSPEARALLKKRLVARAAKRAVNTLGKEEVAEAARQVIREAGHPMIRPDLMRALRERGVVIEGANPDVVLSTMLYRTTGLVTNLKGFGYWLHDEPYPPAGYMPERTGDQPSASQNGSDMINEGIAYKHGERVELRQDESSPWAAKGTIVGPTLPAAGTNFAPQWMVRVDGQHGAHPVPGVCIRRLAEGPSDGGG